LKTTEEVKQGSTWSYFELLCKLMAKKGSDGEMTVPEIGKLINCLSLLGITPADRSRITITNEVETNPFSEFSVAA
jgi:hypothetical protein